MPDIEINSSSVICRRCGQAYGRMKGNFPVSYAPLYKGTGYLPYCRSCVDDMYQIYFSESGDAKKTVRQMCRKLDIYWSLTLFDRVEKLNSNRSMMTSYLAKVASINYAGKGYDDTLREEGTIWNDIPEIAEEKPEAVVMRTDAEDIDIDSGIIAKWGPGYPPSMYRELEDRWAYWMTRYPDGTDLDIGTEALIRQICNLEIDINRDRAAGKSIDKNVNMLNTLLGSAMLKPAQKKDDADAAMEKTPFGVWIKRWENLRPVPEPDPELKDVDGIIRYIEIWFKGHLAKMLGLKNAYSKMYEEEIARRRMEMPDFDEDEDDEDLFNDIFDDAGGEES